MTDASRVNLYLRAENRLVFANKSRSLPIVIVTGFLGSGKTTLMRHILANKHNLRIAAAVNDFAELNVDGNLVLNLPSSTTGKAAEEVVELSNGCMCCSLSKDLERTVWSMLEKDVDVGRIEYLVIETSGITDPYSIVRSLDRTFGKMYRARLDCVVTVVDAEQWTEWMPKRKKEKKEKKEGGGGGGDDADAEGMYAKEEDRNDDEKQQQLSRPEIVDSQLHCADVILVNKKELVSPATLEALIDWISEEAAPGTMVYPTSYSRVALNKILDISIDETSGLASKSSVVTHESSQQAFYVNGSDTLTHKSSHRGRSKKKDRRHDHGHDHERKQHKPGESYKTFSYENSTRPLSLLALQDFCRTKLPSTVVRMKGVFWIHEFGDRRCVLQMSGRRRFHFRLEQSFTGPPCSQLVVIGPELNDKEFKDVFDKGGVVVGDNDDSHQSTKAIPPLFSWKKWKKKKKLSHMKNTDGRRNKKRNNINKIAEPLTAERQPRSSEEAGESGSGSDIPSSSVQSHLLFEFFVEKEEEEEKEKEGSRNESTSWLGARLNGVSSSSLHLLTAE